MIIYDAIPGTGMNLVPVNMATIGVYTYVLVRWIRKSGKLTPVTFSLSRSHEIRLFGRSDIVKAVSG